MPIGQPNVEKLDAHNQVEGLLRASKYKKDPELAEQARLALERRMPVLLDTFQSKNTRHMVLARDAFRQIGQPAVPFLADVVDHGERTRSRIGGRVGIVVVRCIRRRRRSMGRHNANRALRRVELQWV